MHMAMDFPDDPLLILAAAVTGAILLIALAAGWFIYRRRRSRDPVFRMRSACSGVLSDFVLPDGNGGEIEIQYALLVPRGVIVLDIKEVSGHVFGSEAMHEWTVIAADHRYTFANPQPGLWDRAAAVKRLIPEVPVTGYVAFTDGAQFTKGRPSGVVMLEEFLRQIEKDSAKEATAMFQPYWDRLREAAITARM
jgi:hypothetical protein